MAVSAALRAAITRAQNADQHSEPVSPRSVVSDEDV